jgi:hypothetical protein
VARQGADLLDDDPVVVRVLKFRGELAGDRALVRRAEVREHGVEHKDDRQGQRRREEGLGRVAVSTDASKVQTRVGRSAVAAPCCNERLGHWGAGTLRRAVV